MTKNTAISAVNAIGSARGMGLRERPQREGRRPLWDWLEEGHVLELSGTAPGKLSLVARLAARAQRAGEIVVYVAAEQAPLFFPPDLAAMGIDLEALLCVRLATSENALRAAEILLRSGAFGLLILDLPQLPRGELAWQARLLGLVRAHGSRLVILTSTQADQPSLGSFVSLRAEASCQELGSLMRLEAKILKSKLGASIAASPDVRRVPAGAL